MESVYLVWHTHTMPGDDDDEPIEDVKLLGAYSSQSKAADRVERATSLPGFRDHPDGFEVVEYVVDEDSWPDGYQTVD